MFHGPFRVFRPRHPLARLAVAVLGVLAVVLLIALGTFVLIALLIGGGVFMLVNAFRAARRPDTAPRGTPPPGVIEGEFTVVADRATPQG